MILKEEVYEAESVQGKALFVLIFPAFFGPFLAAGWAEGSVAAFGGLCGAGAVATSCLIAIAWARRVIRADRDQRRRALIEAAAETAARELKRDGVV